MKVTFGSDFEMFLLVENDIKPICGLMGGTKTSPIQFPNEPPGFMYQEDGVTAEFNTPVSDSPGQLIKDIQHAMRLGQQLVKEKINKKATLHGMSSATFYREQLEGHPQAMVVGCDPDFQAWYEGRPRAVPKIADFGRMRFAGFHIHVGYDKTLVPEWMIAATLDTYLYSMFDHTCNLRAQHYPRGIFRPKPYGVEYRGLGSSWLRALDNVATCLENWQRDMSTNFGRTLDMALEELPRWQRQLPLPHADQPDRIEDVLVAIGDQVMWEEPNADDEFEHEEQIDFDEDEEVA
jgi:hypothetical protein